MVQGPSSSGWTRKEGSVRSKSCVWSQGPSARNTAYHPFYLVFRHLTSLLMEKQCVSSSGRCGGEGRMVVANREIPSGEVNHPCEESNQRSPGWNVMMLTNFDQRKWHPWLAVMRPIRTSRIIIEQSVGFCVVQLAAFAEINAYTTVRIQGTNLMMIPINDKQTVKCFLYFRPYQ